MTMTFGTNGGTMRLKVLLNSSTPILGDISLRKGMNNWFDNASKYDVANHVSGSGIKAENCYWGPLVGGVPKFSTYGSVDIIPWLSSEPSFNWVRFQDTSTGGSRILAAYPYPFNPTVRIVFHVASYDEHVEMVVYDLMGRRVLTLIEWEQKYWQALGVLEWERSERIPSWSWSVFLPV